MRHGILRRGRDEYQVAVAMDYLAPLAFESRDRLDKVIATLVKVSR